MAKKKRTNRVNITHEECVAWIDLLLLAVDLYGLEGARELWRKSPLPQPPADDED
ncbi:hypothetical protein AncyloWKF20_05115 [Ancylobacter sp. WKF20]|uniref:hypothetical protein n=1 Tax=Ancylobacter sp. WKF20 TaxID=3039801 RepID=UPI0024341F7B|nr:hypothetical protein [Ancylobacter sp. WKF20]WGD31204.1 hypothetical protein AncyloWKF20_05115 [Ancylobacter sp. WKF20]